MTAGIEASLNNESSRAKDSPYCFLLNGCHTKAANGSGREEGGVRNNSALTFDWVLVCTPTMIVAVLMTESP